MAKYYEISGWNFGVKIRRPCFVIGTYIMVTDNSGIVNQLGQTLDGVILGGDDWEEFKEPRGVKKTVFVNVYEDRSSGLLYFGPLMHESASEYESFSSRLNYRDTIKVELSYTEGRK